MDCSSFNDIWWSTFMFCARSMLNCRRTSGCFQQSSSSQGRKFSQPKWLQAQCCSFPVFFCRKKHQIFDFKSIVLVHVCSSHFPVSKWIMLASFSLAFPKIPSCIQRPHLVTKLKNWRGHWQLVYPRCSKSAVTALNGSIHLRGKICCPKKWLEMVDPLKGHPFSRWWFQIFFSFTPYTRGLMIQFDLSGIFFRWVGEKPPTRNDVETRWIGLAQAGLHHQKFIGCPEFLEKMGSKVRAQVHLWHRQGLFGSSWRGLQTEFKLFL